MAKSPVFKSSGNLSNDLIAVEESKALGFGYWKSKFVDLAPSKTWIGGHYCLSRFPIVWLLEGNRINYGRGKVIADWLRIIGMDSRQISELGSIYSQAGVDGVYFEWTEQALPPTQEAGKNSYESLLVQAGDIGKIEMEYENDFHYLESDYPTEPERIAIEEIVDPATKSDSTDIIANTTMTLYNSGGTNVTPIPDVDGDYPIWYEALKKLMLMGASDLIPFTSLVKVSERSYVVGADTYWAVTSKATYTGAFEPEIPDAFIDNIVANSYYTESVPQYSPYIELEDVLVQRRYEDNFASLYWAFVESDQESSNTVLGSSEFKRKFFAGNLDDYHLYPKVDAIKQATPEEMKFLLRYYTKIRVTQEKGKWYNGFLAVVGKIFTFLGEVGAGVFDFLMEIPVVGQFIQLNLWAISKVTGQTLTEVKDFVRENTFKIFLIAYSFGSSSAVEAGLTETLEQVAYEIIEVLANFTVEALQDFLIAMGEILLASPQLVMSEMKQQLIDLAGDAYGNSVTLEEQEVFETKMSEHQEEIEEQARLEKEKESNASHQKMYAEEQEEMYTGMFDVLKTAQLGDNVFDNGGIFDIQNQIERNY